MTQRTPWEEIERHLAAAFEETRTASGVEIRLDHIDRRSNENSHTFHLAYERPLPPARGKIVKTDVTIRERIVLPLEDRPVLRGYEEYRDLPRDAPVRVYSLNEVAVEKTVALLDRARNEPRDLYDLWFLTSGSYVELPELVDPVARKPEFRGLTPAQVRKEFTAKEARYKKLWRVRLVRCSRRCTAR